MQGGRVGLGWLWGLVVKMILMITVKGMKSSVLAEDHGRIAIDSDGDDDVNDAGNGIKEGKNSGGKEADPRSREEENQNERQHEKLRRTTGKRQKRKMIKRARKRRRKSLETGGTFAWRRLRCCLPGARRKEEME